MRHTTRLRSPAGTAAGRDVPRLYRLHRHGRSIAQLSPHMAPLERSLQRVLERHLDDLLGVGFLASEVSIGGYPGGRIDTLALGPDGAPTIVEYKRAIGANIINQGLHYLDWLVDHRAEYRLLVADRLGDAAARTIDWTAPRLICVAASFGRYDARAVRQMRQRVELVRYQWFGAGLILLMSTGPC